MKLVAFEITDPGITVIASGTSTDPSPGIAVVDGSTIEVGREAVAKARLVPRKVHDRFWDNLGTQALGKPHPSHLTAADLAHLHIRSIVAGLPPTYDAALVTVPGHYDRHQVGVLLGIMEAAGVPVRGVADNSVAAAVTESLPHGRVIHLDLLLKRVVVTHLEVDVDVARRRVSSNTDIGINTVRDAWARAIAAIFVRTNRLDPLRLAATEQDLFDQLPSIVVDLDREPLTEVCLNAGGRDHRAEVHRHDLLSVSAPICARITEHATRSVDQPPDLALLTHRAAMVPGLVLELRTALGCEVRTLQPAAAGRGALRSADHLMSPADDIIFATRLPAIGSSVESKGPRQARQSSSADPPGPTTPATHLVYRGRAVPITDQPLIVGTSPPPGERVLQIVGETAGVSRSHCTVVSVDGVSWVDDHSSYGTLLNGERLEGRQPIHAGDRVLLGSPGESLLAVRLED